MPDRDPDPLTRALRCVAQAFSRFAVLCDALHSDTAGAALTPWLLGLVCC